MSNSSKQLWLFMVLLAFFLAIFSCHAQADTIQLNPSGPVFNVGQQLCPQGFNGISANQLSWGTVVASGPCSINNTYVFTPFFNNGTVCAYIYSFAAATRNFTTVSAQTTGDAAASISSGEFNVVPALQSVSGSASSVALTQLAQTPATGPFISPGIPASSAGAPGFPGILSIPISGSAQIAISFVTANGTGGLIFILEQTPGTQCGGGANWNSAPPGLYGGASGINQQQQSPTDVAFYCPKTAFVNNPGTGSIQIVPGVVGLRIRVCSVVFSTSVAGTFKLNEGTGVNCATGGSDVSGTLANTTVSFLYQVGPGAPYILTNVSDSLCFTLGAAATSGTVEVHYGYF